jgi:hypothetical protein
MPLSTDPRLAYPAVKKIRSRVPQAKTTGMLSSRPEAASPPKYSSARFSAPKDFHGAGLLIVGRQGFRRAD